MADSPHDALFRFTFGQSRHAVSLLKAALSPGLAAAIDWRTLRPVPGTMVDDRLRRRQSDLIYRVDRRGAPLWLYVLIEHKRGPDPHAVLQLLHYVVLLWRSLLRAGRAPLPKVLPILIVQSGEREAQPAELAVLLESPPTPAATEALLDRHQPHFAPVVVSLPDLSRQARRSVLMTVVARLTVEALV